MRQKDYLRILAILMAVIAFIWLSGCRPSQSIANNELRRDSVRVEYRERIVMDTVTIEVPEVMVMDMTCDTLSVLETKTAKSTARVQGGKLSHELKTFGRLSTPNAVKVVYRDSVIVAERIRNVEKTVEVNRLTTWQNFQIKGFWILLLVLAATAFVLWLTHR